MGITQETNLLRSEQALLMDWIWREQEMKETKGTPRFPMVGGAPWREAPTEGEEQIRHKHRDCGVRLPGFESQLCHRQAVWCELRQIS